MAITITSIAAPTNVTATLQAGGTLAPNTTYYVVVCAKNENTGSYYTTKTGVLSDASIEISFATDTVNLSAVINWDAVVGALAYNVYLSKISDYYYFNSSGTYTSGRYGVSGVNTCTVNSYTITTVPSANGLDTVSTENLPFNISKNLGTINVSISGTETLVSIYNAIVAAGYGAYCFYDGQNFLIKGTLRIASAVTGSLTIVNTNVYIAQGTILNESTSFTLTFGTYNAVADAAYSGGNIFISGVITFDLTNIKMYAVTISTYIKGIIVNYLTIGVEIIMGADVKYCNFWGIRNTRTNWSNNKLMYPAMLRAWSGIVHTNAYFETAVPITYYAANGGNTYYDCTFKLSTAAYAISMSGLAGNNYVNPCGFYDCDFIGVYYKSINDLIFNFSVWETIQNKGFDFFYSIQGTILDSDKNLISDVNVKCYDKDNTLLFNANTVLGLIPKNYVKVMSIRPTGNGTGTAFYTRTFFSPITIIVSKDGYETYTTKFDLLKKFDEIITLKPVTRTRYTFEGKPLRALTPESGSSSKLLEL